MTAVSLELYFSRAGTLESLKFTHPVLPRPALNIRGKVSMIPGAASFQMTKGVRALAALGVGSVLAHRAAAFAGLASCEGREGSGAQALATAREKNTEWLLDFFGTDRQGLALSHRIIEVTRQEITGAVAVRFNPLFLEISQITVFVGRSRLQDDDSLLHLYQRLRDESPDSRIGRLLSKQVQSELQAYGQPLPEWLSRTFPFLRGCLSLSHFGPRPGARQRDRLRQAVQKFPLLRIAIPIGHWSSICLIEAANRLFGTRFVVDHTVLSSPEILGLIERGRRPEMMELSAITAAEIAGQSEQYRAWLLAPPQAYYLIGNLGPDTRVGTHPDPSAATRWLFPLLGSGGRQVAVTPEECLQFLGAEKQAGACMIFSSSYSVVLKDICPELRIDEQSQVLPGVILYRAGLSQKMIELHGRVLAAALQALCHDNELLAEIVTTLLSPSGPVRQLHTTLSPEG